MKLAMIMKPIKKIWGTTTPLVVTPLFEMHRLDIKPWHRCSYHEHKFKHNAFFIISGVLFIDESPHRPSHRLAAGNTLTIQPGTLHQFRTDGDACAALEMYYCEPLSEDIHRRTEGGPIDH